MAISTFIFEAGIATVWWLAALALRMRVSMSAIVSLIMAVYQELFLTPGICPCEAMPRKQTRHIPNLRM